MALCTMLKLFTLTGFRLRIHCFPALTPTMSAWTCSLFQILGMCNGNDAHLSVDDLPWTLLHDMHDIQLSHGSPINSDMPSTQPRSKGSQQLLQSQRWNVKQGTHTGLTDPQQPSNSPGASWQSSHLHVNL